MTLKTAAVQQPSTATLPPFSPTHLATHLIHRPRFPHCHIFIVGDSIPFLPSFRGAPKMASAIHWREPIGFYPARLNVQSFQLLPVHLVCLTPKPAGSPRSFFTACFSFPSLSLPQVSQKLYVFSRTSPKMDQYEAILQQNN